MTTTTFYIHFEHDYDITSPELRRELAQGLRDIATYFETNREVAEEIGAYGQAEGVINTGDVRIGKWGLLHVTSIRNSAPGEDVVTH